MPRYTTVVGGGESLVFKTKGGIVMDLSLFAGEYNAFPAIGAGLLNHCFKKLTGIAASLTIRMSGYAKNHLPLAILFGIGGI